MTWVPIVFIIFKIVVIGTGMFFAVKWHYDQDKKRDTGEGISVFVKMVAIFIISLMVMFFATITVAKMLGMELTYS